MQERQIPIQNLFYLLCYAWDQLEQGKVIDVTRSPTMELVDLYAVVLCDGVKHLSRRGLEQGYEAHVDELSSLRGRIDVYASMRRFLPIRGRAVCEFDELTTNTLNNQILKGTLRLLAAAQNIDAGLKQEVTRCYRGLDGVEDVPISAATFRRVQLHSNTSFYRFLLNVCELVWGSYLVNSTTGNIKFKEFIRDERAMARVFERFLFNFMKREVDGVKVKRDQISWQAESVSDPTLAMLPSMNTDISVEVQGARLIIDAKYYLNPLRSRWEADKLQSHNLYQLMSYLTNAAGEGGEELAGMLIYPRTDTDLKQSYVIQGYPVYVATLDLNQNWRDIHRDLLGLVRWGLESFNKTPA